MARLTDADIPVVTFPHVEIRDKLFENRLTEWERRNASVGGKLAGGPPVPYIRYTCIECGEENVTDSYSLDYRIPMRKEQCCFNCIFWHKKVEEYERVKDNPQSRMTIISGNVYAPGDGDPRYQSICGMAGRRFDIEYITGPHKGQRITTTDLWSGGLMPERYREKMPDNAIFLDGAARHQVGETGCWNQSSGKTPEYPRPRTLFGPVRR